MYIYFRVICCCCCNFFFSFSILFDMYFSIQCFNYNFFLGGVIVMIWFHHRNLYFIHREKPPSVFLSLIITTFFVLLRVPKTTRGSNIPFPKYCYDVNCWILMLCSNLNKAQFEYEICFITIYSNYI